MCFTMGMLLVLVCCIGFLSGLLTIHYLPMVFWLGSAKELYGGDQGSWSNFNQVCNDLAGDIFPRYAVAMVCPYSHP